MATLMSAGSDSSLLRMLLTEVTWSDDQAPGVRVIAVSSGLHADYALNDVVHLRVLRL